MADNYLGAWRVTETVFNPDDTYAGYVHQRRELLRLENGNLRVIQDCEVSAELQTHPMGNFQGEWVFDLHVDGQSRYYLGEDVVGMGIQYVDGVMTGRGHWPRFGPEFVSFGFLDGAERQITGGVFHNNGTAIAKIIGIAVTETDKDEWPEIITLSDKRLVSRKQSFEPIVGKATYQVWAGLLAELVASGQRSKLAPLIMGMLQYTYQVAAATKNETPLAKMLIYDAGDVDEAGDMPHLIRQATKRLFAHTGIGDDYSVMHSAFEDFIYWHDFPWNS